MEICQIFAIKLYDVRSTPHSLGKPIEWKYAAWLERDQQNLTRNLPTRWGNQLNGKAGCETSLPYLIR